jgi:hypothetical protein
LALPASAQHHEHAAGDEASLGRVAFPTTCAPEVQEDFDRAIAMLHSFWYGAAEKTFATISERDPECAIARWGIAMSRFRQLWEKPVPEDLRIAREALAAAEAIGARSERERGYIGALATYFTDADELDHLDRKRAYQEAMDALQRRYPDDPEAKIFHALSVLGTAYSSPPDATYRLQKKAGSILESLLAEQPEHPGLAHYIIHSYDYPPLAEQALGAARRYAEIAPEAPHALHMPSHIFTRLGLWRESIDSNLAAAAAAKKDGWTGEELHASDYLTYAYLQSGREDEARRMVETLPEQAARLKPTDPNYPAGVYALAAMPARWAVERRQWAEAAALEAPDGLPSEVSFCWAEATLLFARGLGAANTGAPVEAPRIVAELGACRKTLSEAGQTLWANAVSVQERAVAARLALAQGEADEALALMRAAADLEDGSDKSPITPGPIVPARELLGELLLELDRPAEALAEFDTVLASAPNRLRALEGAARAAAAGNSGREAPRDSGASE